MCLRGWYIHICLLLSVILFMKLYKDSVARKDFLPGGAVVCLSISLCLGGTPQVNEGFWGKAGSNAHSVGMDFDSLTHDFTEKCKLYYFTAAGRDAYQITHSDVLSIRLSSCSSSSHTIFLEKSMITQAALAKY